MYLNFLNIRFFSAQIIKQSYLFYKASLYIFIVVYSHFSFLLEQYMCYVS